ncbi:MAG: hypothetical protein BWX84_00302 [Verrucomicrobia bacterium ADurb.Bin118]|nr:hypothetical protein [Verrucomicrobiota bacterium]OQB94253.1 MAG: hypothetical protein BWX84_00302 [Verrucomicrobia bacterium ADurb.Bin118]
MATVLAIELMSIADDHRWDLREREDGYLPESDEAFDQKFEEWQERDWPDWLAKNLTFPFSVTREEDEDDAYFAPGAAKAPFRLGHKMEVLELGEDDVDRGVLVKVREKGKIGYVPLCDVEVTPKTDANFWPVREYVVWFANRC